MGKGRAEREGCPVPRHEHSVFEAANSCTERQAGDVCAFARVRARVCVCLPLSVCFVNAGRTRVTDTWFVNSWRAEGRRAQPNRAENRDR